MGKVDAGIVSVNAYGIYLLLWLISPWLDIFPNHHLWLGFHDLIQVMNQFQPYFPDG
jgi:hypothetical protein